MRKILVIAMLALFATSALAIDVQIWGYYEIEGRFYNNANMKKASVEKSKRSTSQIYNHLRIWGKISVDENTSITMRMNPIKDNFFGNWGGKTDKNAGKEMHFDRAWVSHDFGMFQAHAGKMQSNNFYIGNFGTLHAYQQFVSVDAATGLASVGKYDGPGITGLDQVLFTIEPIENLSFFAAYIVAKEGHTKNAGAWSNKTSDGDRAADVYIALLGTEIKLIEDLRIAFSASFQRNETIKEHQRYAFYLGAEWNLESLLVRGALGMDFQKSKATKNNSSFGVFVEGKYKHDLFNVGLLAAYGSYEKPKAGSKPKSQYVFMFGDDFGYTYITDDKLFDNTGAAAMTTVQLYGDFTFAEDFTVDAVAAYYFSNVKKDNALTIGDLIIGKKTRIFEVDAGITYQWTDATSFKLGAAFANVDKQGPKGSTTKGDGLTAVYWNATTNF